MVWLREEKKGIYILRGGKEPMESTEGKTRGLKESRMYCNAGRTEGRWRDEIGWRDEGR